MTLLVAPADQISKRWLRRGVIPTYPEVFKRDHFPHADPLLAVELHITAFDLFGYPVDRMNQRTPCASARILNRTLASIQDRADSSANRREVVGKEISQNRRDAHAGYRDQDVFERLHAFRRHCDFHVIDLKQRHRPRSISRLPDTGPVFRIFPSPSS